MSLLPLSKPSFYLCIALLFSSFNLFASIKVTGTFDAVEQCQAYISKNKKTNPDQLYVHNGERYSIKEINRQIPNWLRIELPVQNHPLRWVRASCGQYQYSSQDENDCEIKAGLADSYVLALSWQPGFCQTYGFEAGKPECFNLKKQSYSFKHLSLHGLWPNQKACGHHYSFCGVPPKKHHCGYPPLKLTVAVASQLKKNMPSYAHGSCLERHEWNKHGSCQILSSDAYFSLAMRLAEEADDSALGQFLREYQGQKIKRTQLRQKIIDAFGVDAKDKIYIGCGGNTLVDIYIQLPALIPREEPLTHLIDKAPSANRLNGCPNWLYISNFTNEQQM